MREALDRVSHRIDLDLANHPRSLAAIHRTMAEAYWSIGELNSAAEHFHAAVNSTIPDSSVDDEEVHCTRMQLVRLQIFAGKYDSAEEILRKLHDQYAVDGDVVYSADVWELQGQLAYWRDELSRSIALIRRSLAARRRAFGDQDPAVAVSLDHLATSISEVDIDEAIDCAREALGIRRHSLGQKHPETAWAMNGLSFYLAQRGRGNDLRGAERLLREALPLHTEGSGERSLEVATTLSELGSVVGAQGRIDEARELYYEALAKKRALLGENHLEVAQTLDSVGRFLIEIGNPGEAIPLLQQAVSIRRDRLGENHPETVCSQERLTRAQELSGKP